MFCSLSREGAKFSNNNSGEGWWTEYNYSSRSTAVLQLYQLYPGTVRLLISGGSFS
jgi:hypothetical protein